MMKNSVELYIEKADLWKDEMTLLRKILLECSLTETIKWSIPCYMFEGKNILVIQSFKSHCDIGFFKGALLKDPKNLLEKAGENTQSSRQLRFTNIDEIQKKKNIIKSFVKEAIQIEKEGIQLVIEEKPGSELIEELEIEFKKNKKFERAFKKLTPGRQRGYLIYFSGTKNSDTRMNRIEKNISRIMDGFGIHDCTCGLSKRMPNCDGSHKFLKTK